jgi:RimJ/RimL family protein N-acetyltransferase
MADEEIQKATASEPLTLEEEYAMQRSWRTDADKLTFIVCTRTAMGCSGTQTQSVSAGKEDAPAHMVGDVNLFLYDDDEDAEDPDASNERSVVGELEIMIALQHQRGKGLAQDTLRAFMCYIQSQLSGIGREFAGAKGMRLKYLRVKIDKDNVRSLRLFERVGFVRTSAEPNYFGEVEMRTPVVEGRLREVERKIGLEGFGTIAGYEM